MFRSSYTNHYRAGLIKLLRLLEFRSNNAEHQPVLDGLKLILRFADSKAELYPLEVPVVLDGVVKADWREFATSTDHRGRQRVVRIVYECSVLEALRDRLRCKEVWVVGADEWRNPDEDLPEDFADKREENYAKLNLPLAAKQFTDSLKDEMRRELTVLNTALPGLDWLEISDRKTGAIKLTAIDALPAPRNLRKLKRACVARWGTVLLRRSQGQHGQSARPLRPHTTRARPRCPRGVNRRSAPATLPLVTASLTAGLHHPPGLDDHLAGRGPRTTPPHARPRRSRPSPLDRPARAPRIPRRPPPAAREDPVVDAL